MIWALHGAVGMADDWRQFAACQEIREVCGEVRRLDLWRFLECCPMPLTQVGDTLAEEIQRIDPAPVLLGYSMGGRLALQALLSRPDFWSGAIIVSAHTGLSHETERVARRQKDTEWSALALRGDWAEFLNQWQGQGVLQGELGDAELPSRLPLKSRRASIAKSFMDWSLGAQEDLSTRLGEIECPVMWVTGKDDEKFTEIGRRATEILPRGEHHIFDRSGHRVPWSQPTEFARKCHDFIETHSLG